MENIKFGESYQRNPLLASFCARGMNYRGLGSGIVRAFADGASIEFVNNDESDTFKAILYRKALSSDEGGQKTDEGGQKTDEGGQKTDEGGQKTDEGGQKNDEGGQKTDEGGQKNENLILRLIKNNPKISRREMSELIGISPSAIQKRIEKLRAMGEIKRVGPDKGGYWEIIQDND